VPERRVLVRPSHEADGAAIRRIFVAAGRMAWPHILPVERLSPPRRWFGERDSETLVAEIDGRVVGFAIVRASGDEDAGREVGELDGLYTDPSVWGGGVGRLLLREAEARLSERGFREATLWTAEENHRPRRIYEAAGWHPDGACRQRSLHGADFVELRYRHRLG
jgi:GNAT superfamily N-acetyltransferase